MILHPELLLHHASSRRLDSGLFKWEQFVWNCAFAFLIFPEGIMIVGTVLRLWFAHCFQSFWRPAARRTIG